MESLHRQHVPAGARSGVTMVAGVGPEAMADCEPCTQG